MAMVIPSTLLNSDIWTSKWTCCSVAKSCQTLHNPMDCSSPGSSVLGILQAKILEWVIIPFSRGIFPTQGLKPGLLYCRQIIYQLSHRESTYYLPEFAQIHIHWVSDAIYPSYPLPSSSPFAFSLSFPMSWLFASGGQSIGALSSATVLPINIQD